jgi:hypothetical protein
MRIVPAKNGAAWLVRGFALFRRNPPAWLLLVLVYWLAVALLGQLPYAGRALSMVVLPAFTMSFMALCALLDAGAPVTARTLFDAFRTRFGVLVTVGALYLVCILAVLALASLADDGVVLDWVLAGREPSADAIEEGRASRGLVIAALAGTPVLMAFWFAPPLVGWGGMGAAQSLFYSFFATLRNWRALLAYGAVLMLAGVAVVAVISMLAVVTRGNADAVRSALLLASLLSLPILFGSFYASYRDVFPQGGAAVDGGP